MPVCPCRRSSRPSPAASPPSPPSMRRARQARRADWTSPASTVAFRHTSAKKSKSVPTTKTAPPIAATATTAQPAGARSACTTGVPSQVGERGRRRTKRVRPTPSRVAERSWPDPPARLRSAAGLQLGTDGAVLLVLGPVERGKGGELSATRASGAGDNRPTSTALTLMGEGHTGTVTPRRATEYRAERTAQSKRLAVGEASGPLRGFGPGRACRFTATYVWRK